MKNLFFKILIWVPLIGALLPFVETLIDKDFLVWPEQKQIVNVLMFWQGFWSLMAIIKLFLT